MQGVYQLELERLAKCGVGYVHIFTYKASFKHLVKYQWPSAKDLSLPIFVFLQVRECTEEGEPWLCLLVRFPVLRFGGDLHSNQSTMQ